jgi:hypothetical protein
MTREELEALWNDRRHWKWGVYYCKADPRVIVPKRWKWMGWTINAAHPSSILVVLVLVALCLGAPILIAKANGGGPSVVMVSLAIGIAALCLICAYLSSRTS